MTEPLFLLIRLGCHCPYLLFAYFNYVGQTGSTEISIKEVLAAHSSWEEFTDLTGIKQTTFVHPYCVYDIKNMATKVLPIIQERKQKLKKTKTLFDLEIAEKKMLAFHDVVIKTDNQF